MKRIITILAFIICAVTSNAQQHYKPSLHAGPQNKPSGISSATPLDSRSYFYDTLTFSYRPYANRAEVLSYLYLATYRRGQFTIIIDSISHKWAYWFRDSTRDQDLVLQYNFAAAATDSSVFATLYRLDTAKTNLRSEIAGKISTTLPTGQILAGNLSNVATPVTPGGVLTMTSGGSFDYVTNSLLFSKIQQIPSHTVIGNPTGSTATPRSTYLKYGFLFDGDSTKIDTTLLKNVFGAGTVGWGLTGNSGTVEGINFIGTTDDIPLSFRVNNVASGYIGNVSTLNTFFGNASGSSITDGQGNTLMGYQAGITMQGATNNVGMGLFSLVNNRAGNFNTAIGVGTMAAMDSGYGNTAIGVSALTQSSDTKFNTVVGSFAGYKLTGNYNILLTNDSTSNSPFTTASGNTVIGGNLTTLSPTLTNSVVIGNGKGTERLRFDGSGNYKATPQASVSDTTTYKAKVVDASGNEKVMSFWPTASGGGGGNPKAGVGITVNVDTVKLDTLYRDNRIMKIFNVKTYGAYGDGIEKLRAASVTATNDTLVCSTCSFVTATDTGKVIKIDSAGTSFRDLVTTIKTVVNSTTIVLNTVAISTYATCRIVYGHDDTNPIQLAINAANTAGGGKVWFPEGLYIINGALQTSVAGANPNSQLYIPSPTDSRDTNRTRIVLEGEVGPNFIPNTPGYFNTIPYYPGKKGSVLLSTLTGSGTVPAVLGTMPPSTSQFNYSTVAVNNLTMYVRMNPAGAGPTMTGINFGYASSAQINYFHFEIDGAAFDEPLPTNDVAGIIMPFINSETENCIRNSMVVGTRYGIVLSEHCVLDNTAVMLCYGGYVPLSANHASYGQKVMTHWCRYDIYSPAAPILGQSGVDSSFFSCSNFDVERLISSGHWYDNVATIWDSVSLANGFIWYHIANGGSSHSANTSFSVVGATRLVTNPVEHPYQVMNSNQINVSTLGALTPFTVTSSASNPEVAITGSSVFPITIVSNNVANGSYYAQNTNASSQAGFYAENNHGSGSTYGFMTVGGSSEAGTLFGLNRADAGFLVFDGGTLASGGIGTLTNTPFVIGTNNTSAIRVNGDQKVGFGVVPTTQYHFRKDQNANTVLLLENQTTGAGASSVFRLMNDNLDLFQFNLYSSATTPYGTFTAGTGGVYMSGAAGMAIMADNATGNIRFATGGNSEIAQFTAAGKLQLTTAPDSVGTATGGCLFRDAATGIIKRVACGSGTGGSDTLKDVNVGHGITTSFVKSPDTLATKTILFTNGLTGSTLSDSTIQGVLGGSLIQNTTVDGVEGAYNLTFNSLNILTLGANETIIPDGILKLRTFVTSSGTFNLDNAIVYSFTGTTSTGTLPAVSGSDGRIIYIKNRGSGNLTIVTTASANEIYDTAATNTLTIAAGAAIKLVSDGTYYLKL